MSVRTRSLARRAAAGTPVNQEIRIGLLDIGLANIDYTFEVASRLRGTDWSAGTVATEGFRTEQLLVGLSVRCTSPAAALLEEPAIDGEEVAPTGAPETEPAPTETEPAPATTPVTEPEPQPPPEPTTAPETLPTIEPAPDPTPAPEPAPSTP